MAAGRKRECFIRALLSFPEGCFVKLESRAERFFMRRIWFFLHYLKTNVWIYFISNYCCHSHRCLWVVNQPVVPIQAMNFFPHIPMLSTVFSSIGCYLLPFGVVLLWLLYESRKVKAILLAGLVILSMVCMFFHEACAPSREYPWDCMVEHIFTGTLLPFLCLLGYILYVFLCACIPVYRNCLLYTSPSPRD